MNDNNKAVELTDEEAAKAAGGYLPVRFSFYCPKCKKSELYTIDVDALDIENPLCRHCGTRTEIRAE